MNLSVQGLGAADPNYHRSQAAANSSSTKDPRPPHHPVLCLSPFIPSLPLSSPLGLHSLLLFSPLLGCALSLPAKLAGCTELKLSNLCWQLYSVSHPPKQRGRQKPDCSLEASIILRLCSHVRIISHHHMGQLREAGGQQTQRAP